MSREPAVWILIPLLAVACHHQDPKVGLPGETAGAGTAAPTAVDSEAAPTAVDSEAASPGAASSPAAEKTTSPEGEETATATPKDDSTAPPIVSGPARSFEGPSDDPMAGIDELDESCRVLAQQLVEIRPRIPFLFLDLGEYGTLDEIDAHLARAATLGEEFLAKCPDAPQTAYVAAMAGRDMLGRLQRHVYAFRIEVQKSLEDSGISREEKDEELERVVRDETNRYLSRIRELADLAMRAEPGTTAHYHALALRADVAEKDGNYPERIRLAKEILATYPKAEHSPKFLMDVGKGYFHEARYQEAADWMRVAATKHEADIEYVGYVSVLFEALNGIADLDGMAALMAKVEKDFPARAKEAAETSAYYASQYEQWYDIRDFWVGFVHYAKGDAQAALPAFERAKAHIDERERQLAAEGKSLPSVQKIYRDFRIIDLIQFLNDYHSQPARVSGNCVGTIKAADFSDGIEWVTKKTLTLQSALGKVVPILFRLPGNRRAETFFEELDSISSEMPEVEALCLAFLPNRASDAQKGSRYDAMRADIQQLGIEMPVGYDTSPNQCVFRSIHATVGSASFMVYGKDGKIAWYLPDPRDMDRALLRKVLERLARD